MRDSTSQLAVSPGDLASGPASARDAAVDFSAFVFRLTDRSNLSLRATVTGGLGVAGALLAPRVGWSVSAVVLATAVAALAGWRWMRGGWAWPWQRAVLWLDVRQRAEVARLLGDGAAPRVRSVVSTGATTGSSPVARYRLLGAMGRDDEAAALADGLPSATPQDRYGRAMALAWARWRVTGRLDLGAARVACAELDGDARLAAEVSITVWGAVAESRAAGVSGPMADVVVRALPSPPAVRLSGRSWLRLWRLRLWPAEWLVGAFGLASFVLYVARVVARA